MSAGYYRKQMLILIKSISGLYLTFYRLKHLVYNVQDIISDEQTYIKFEICMRFKKTTTGRTKFGSVQYNIIKLGGLWPQLIILMMLLIWVT